MRALSIRDPHASQILSGEKRIENRSWGERVRGPIALHRCGKGGAIIGVMEITEVIGWEEALARYPDQDAYISGPLCWVIGSVRQLPEPIPCPGRLSLWECPDL
jgi:hypothetical protein